MQKIINYFKRDFFFIKDCFYNLDFYKNIETIDIKSTLWKIIKITFLIGLFVYIPAFGAMYSFIQNNKNEIPEFFPEELEIVIKDGIASSNVAEPYYFGEYGMYENESAHRYVFVVHTQNDMVLSDLEKADASIIISKTFYAIADQNGQFKIHPYEIMGENEFTINRQSLYTVIERISPFIEPIVIIAYSLTVLFSPLFIAINMFFVAIFFSLITMLVQKLRKVTVGYAHIFRMTLCAMIPGLLIDMVLNKGILITLPIFIIILIVNTQKINN